MGFTPGSGLEDDEMSLVTEVRSTIRGAGNYAERTASRTLRASRRERTLQAWLLNRNRTQNSPLV